MPLITTSDTSFEVDVLKSAKPVVVDFWAEWCGPCKMIAPFLEELAVDKDETVVVAKVNIDDNPLTPTQIRRARHPHVDAVQNGEIAATKVGAMPKTKLYEWVEELL